MGMHSHRFAGLFALTLSLLAVGCSVDTTETANESQDELRSVASGFYLKQPFAGARMETLRKELASIDDAGRFVRNYHLSAGVHFDTRSTHALTDAERADLVQAAYTFWMGQNDPSAKSRRWAKGLARTSDLASALDRIGLEVDMSDPESDAARASLEKTLGVAAATKNVSVWSAT